MIDRRAEFAGNARRRDLIHDLAVSAAIPENLIPVFDQLLSGVVDATACRELNMSPRTFSRRVAEVLELLGVATRFQAGAECIRRASARVEWNSQQGPMLTALAVSTAVAEMSDQQDVETSWRRR
jgi:hypothetical protein